MGNRGLLAFVGWGPVLLVMDPADKEIADLKIEKIVDIFIFCCSFKKCVFVDNRAIFVVFGPWCPL